ncbi:MAG: type II toxin-antitoxin system PemK/MazF family toxin [Chloroflexota bacterium]
MEVKRGDVFLVDLNPVIGTEQAGIRPALVMQIDRANIASPHTIIIPFTTRIKDTTPLPRLCWGEVARHSYYSQSQDKSR